VTNGPVFKLHGKGLLESLWPYFGQVSVIKIGDGERFKNQATLSRIYDGLFRARADRGSWILAFGGGVVGDIAGYAAATFMRGIRYASIPTTLLAQVDSSVGGKVAINCAQGKNLIGAFHQPAAVLSDTTILKTLPSRELASGLYEVVKCGAIASASLIRYLRRNLDAILCCESKQISHIVTEAARIKAGVVAADEREAHMRMILNFGHTLGHALETATSYRQFKHGEAVAWGMIAAAEFSGLRRAETELLAGLIHSIERLPALRGISPDAVWKALLLDKKSQKGKTRWVLLRRLGEAEIREDSDTETMRGLINDFLAREQEHSWAMAPSKIK
jgi:3-dehydroquinate synthase